MSKTFRLKFNGEARLLGSFPPSTSPEILQQAASHLCFPPNDTSSREKKEEGDLPLLHAIRAGIRFSLQSMDDVDRLWNGELLHIFGDSSSCCASYLALPVLSAIPCDQKVTEMSSSTLDLPLSRAPLLNSVDDLRQSPPEKRAELMEAIRNHGHFFVKVEKETFERMMRGRGLMKGLFEDSLAAKKAVEMEGKLRIWGWKRVEHKKKECFKMRYCKDMENRWPTTFPPLPEMLEVYDTLHSLGRTCAKELLLHGGMISDEEIDAVLTHGKLASDPEKEFAASFFEIFRYEPHTTTEIGKADGDSTVVTKGVVSPCEDHYDVGLVTVSMKSTASEGGLQIHDWADGWVQCEPRMGPDGTPIAIVLLGEHLEAMTGGVFSATPHRVVVATQKEESKEGKPTGSVDEQGEMDSVPPSHHSPSSSSNEMETRFSMIAEVLPFPEATVPAKFQNQNNGKEFRGPSWNVFKLNSLGVSSVNFE